MGRYMAYGFEGGDLALATRDVVDDKASSGLSSVLVVEEVPVRDLRYALVCSIAGLEVDIRGPVVGKLSPKPSASIVSCSSP